MVMEAVQAASEGLSPGREPRAQDPLAHGQGWGPSTASGAPRSAVGMRSEV